MTIPAGYQPSSYAGNGATTAFSLPHKVDDADDVVVVITDDDGVNTTQPSTAYTVTGVGDEDGVTVTMTTAPATGESITLSIDPVTEQQTNFLPLGIFPAENTEDALDRLTRVAQVHRQKINRSIRVPDTDDELDELPTATVRASRYVAFDSNGDLTTSSGTGADDGLRADLAAGDAGLVDSAAISYDQTAAEIAAGVTPVYFYVKSRRPERIVINASPGATDMTTDIQAALNACPQYGSIIFDSDRSGIFLISGLLTVPTDNIDIYFNGAVLKAQANTTFSAMMTCANRTGVRLHDGEFNINGANRTTGQASTHNAISFSATTDCSMKNMVIRNAYGYSGTSATAVAASGNCTRFVCDGSKFIDCGGDENNTPSDGLFVRGSNCQIINTQAYRCKDTAFVLEGCNKSVVANCIAEDCTSLAAISNDTASDYGGNTIDGLTGSSSYIGSTGGLVAVACFGAGNLLQNKVQNVNIRLLSATGLGPGLQVRKTSTGRVDGLDVDNFTLNIGAASGVLAQGMLIQSSDNVKVTNPTIVQDLTAGADCIKFSGDCVGGQVIGGRLVKGTRGVNVVDTSSVIVQGVKIQDQDDYGINVGDTASVTSRGNSISGASLLAYEAKAAGATLVSDHFQTWTPTYASDVGNAATTFSGAVTTTNARIRVIGKKCEVEVNFSATLNAVTPAYISLTLPTGIAPQSSNVQAPAVVSNAGTYETGIIRAITSSNEIRIYRANVVNFGSGAAIVGIASFSFELT